MVNDLYKRFVAPHADDRQLLRMSRLASFVVLLLGGFVAWLMWLFIHILFLVGFRNKLAVLLGWAFAYIKDNPSARVIINPPNPQSGP